MGGGDDYLVTVAGEAGGRALAVPPGRQLSQSSLQGLVQALLTEAPPPPSWTTCPASGTCPATVFLIFPIGHTSPPPPILLSSRFPAVPSIHQLLSGDDRPGVRILLLRGVPLGSDPVLHCGGPKGRLWLEAMTQCSADNSLEAVGNSFPFFFFSSYF